MKELTRFPNQTVRIGGKYYWNIFSLYQSLKEGMQSLAKENIQPDAIGIDTWGVDFVYLGEDDSILGLPRAYRDPYTNGVPEAFFQVVPRKDVYGLTGIQIMNFNSLFQLYAARRENSSALSAARSILFMPDALSYLLTGKKVCEYTIASTSQFLNPKTKKIEAGLLEAAGIDPAMIPEIVQPGTIIGNLLPELASEYKWGEVPVVAVAGHDTGSAVAAVPAENERFAYLSSGTWSLMGIEVKDPVITEDSFRMNFTNEGGVEGTTRFLKNITGMWLLEQCRKEWERDGKNYSYPAIVSMSESAPAFQFFIDPDDPGFAQPDSMTAAIREYCLKTGQQAPEQDAEFIRCIFESLALKYRFTFNRLKQVAPFTIEKLHVIGGGAQNALLNQFTANALGIEVISGPSEATAIGNLMIQAQAVGLVRDLGEIRRIIRRSVETNSYHPENNQLWEEAYQRFTLLPII